MFSGHECGVDDPLVESVLEVAPGLAERRAPGDRVRELGIELGEGRADDSRVGLGEEDGESSAVGGQRVTLGAGRAADRALAPETAQEETRGQSKGLGMVSGLAWPGLKRKLDRQLPGYDS